MMQSSVLVYRRGSVFVPQGSTPAAYGAVWGFTGVLDNVEHILPQEDYLQQRRRDLSTWCSGNSSSDVELVGTPERREAIQGGLISAQVATCVSFQGYFGLEARP